jgi:hypothetical protein
MRFILIVENTFFYISASVGVSALFVFGFAVYNVSPSVPTRDLDWCFYVNLVAVILAVIAAILLSIYDTLLKKPLKYVRLCFSWSMINFCFLFYKELLMMILLLKHLLI